MQRAKSLLFVGLSLMTGFIWGLLFSPDIHQHYSNLQMPVGKYDQMVSVDVIKNGDDIWIVEHKTGHLIFEYNRFKEADKEAFGEYQGLLVEALNRN